MLRALFCLLLAALSPALHAEIVVQDDSGRSVRLPAAAQRIISLAPHVTELLYAAGAGDKLVGVVEFSNYPEAAKKLPRVGSYERFDAEAILALKPDLIIGWQSGNPAAQIEKLRALKLPLYLTQPNTIDHIAVQLERIGQLAGTEKPASAAAANFRSKLDDLRKRYASQPKIRVFYQIWKQPLLTAGAPQIISSAIQLCGGENVFGQLSQMAPTVTVEAVIAAAPEAIVASGMDEARPEWLDDWKRWKQIPAVQRDNLYFVPPDLIQRHTPRFLEGTELLCKALEAARTRAK